MRLRKKILGLAIIVFGLGGFGSFLGVSVASPVYAATGDTANTPVSTMEEDFRNLADIFLKIAYVILWPLIMLSGLALDNTMVYGEIFHMDAPLRQFRNICKNLANFALGFMILYEIIKSVLTMADTKKPMDVIKKAIISGILIQMSWFLVAALIDVSTVTTYAVGGMPMSILKADAKMNSMKILQPDVTMNLNSEKKMTAKDFVISYQVKTQEGNTILLSPCDRRTHNKQSYIVGRLYGDEKFKNEGKLGLDASKDGVNACVHLNEVKFFYEFPDLVNLTGQVYRASLENILGADQRNVWEACGYIIKVGNGTPTTAKCAQSEVTAQNIDKNLQKRFDNIKEEKVDANAGATRFNNSAATSIGNIIEKSKGFVGPLATIYTSMLDFANLTDTSNANGSERRGIGELIIRTGVAVGLIFPLLALTIVLIIRIGFLRCIIGASPLIILAYFFDIKTGLENHINPMNIIKAIFAPVVTVFALSMGLIFMAALVSMYKVPDGNTGKKTVISQALEPMGITQKIGTGGDTYDTMNIFGVVLRYPQALNSYAGATGDWFSWMLVCFSGIGIMRFILFAAIGATGTIGGVGKTIKDFGEKMVSTTPILSIPGMKGKVGIGTAFDNLSPTSTSAWGNANAAFANSDFVDAEGQNKNIQKTIADIGKKSEASKNAETIKIISSENYQQGEKIARLTGDEKKNGANDIISAVNSNKDIDTWLRGLNPDEQTKVLTGLGPDVKTKRQASETKAKFGQDLGNAKTEDDLKEVLRKNETEIIKAEPEYSKTIKIDKTEYTIKTKSDKSGLEYTTTTPSK